MGFLEALTLIFVVCQMTGIIAWTWWWVFSPMLIGYGMIVLFLVLAFGLGFVFGDG